MQVRPKDVGDDVVVDKPCCQTLTDTLQLHDVFTVADLVEHVDVRVYLRDARQSHRQR